MTVTQICPCRHSKQERVNGEIRIQLDHPAPMTISPLKIKVELASEEQQVFLLGEEIENLLREELICRAAVDPVPAESLSKFEHKAYLVHKSYAQ